MIFRAQPLPGDLNRRPEAPGPDLQLENAPIEPDPPEHCHTATKTTKRGQPYIVSGGENQLYTKKEPSEPIFLFWPARTNMEGAVSGRGANIYAYWRLWVRIPLCTCDFCCWLLGLWRFSSPYCRSFFFSRNASRQLWAWALSIVCAGILAAKCGCARVLLRPPRAVFLALKRAHMGTLTHLLARKKPKSARKIRKIVGSQAPAPL